MKGQSKRILAILLLSFLIMMTFFLSGQGNDDQNYELLYQAKSDLDAKMMATQYGLELIALSSYHIALYEAPDKMTHATLLNKGFAENQQSVSQAGPLFRITDPYYEDQYHIPMMAIEEAWEITEGSAALLVAIIDTGIDTDHGEFAGRISPLSYNARTRNVGIAHVEDTNGHGTMVAGIIGANKDNRLGIAGILNDAQLMVIKANNEEGTYDDGDLIEAIRYATANGAKVINMSLGGTYANPLIEDAIDDAVALGAVVVAASGNDGDDTLIYPAAFPNTISVGAIDHTRTITSFSNHNGAVDVVAPGSSVISTYPNQQFMVGSGTSFAVPMVAGVLGLMFCADPNLSATAAMTRIRTTATDLGDLGRDDFYGYGLINAMDALPPRPVTISFDTDGGIPMDSIVVSANDPFEVGAPSKDHHTFDGWYLDWEFQNPFVSGLTTVNRDTILYAKFIPIDLTVSFVTSGDSVFPMVVAYGSSIVLPLATKDGHEFAGWFQDEAYEHAYAGEPMTTDLVLYAKFEPKVFQVVFVSGGSDVLPQLVPYGAVVSLPETTLLGFRFLGWYYDSNQTFPYGNEPITSDITLYGFFSPLYFDVMIYGADMVTVIKTYVVAYGASVDPDIVIAREPSMAVIFTFAGWNQPLDEIRSDLMVYPVFTYELIEGSIGLAPGIDTVFAQSGWIDAGLSHNDQNLVVMVSSDVDDTMPGVYEVIYDLVVDGVVIGQMRRMVMVLSKPLEIIITLNPDVTTIMKDTPYVDAGAQANIGTVISQGEVDTTLVGSYQITYTVTVESTVTTKIKMVHVIAGPVSNSILDLPRKEEGWWFA